MCFLLDLLANVSSSGEEDAGEQAYECGYDDVEMMQLIDDARDDNPDIGLQEMWVL